MAGKTKEPNYIIEINEPARVQALRGNRILVHDVFVCVFSLFLIAIVVISVSHNPGGRGMWVVRCFFIFLSFLLFFLIRPVTKLLPTELYFFDKVLLIHREGRHVLGMDVCIQEYIAYDDVLFCLYDKEKMRLEIHCAYRTLWHDAGKTEDADPVLNEVSDDCCIINLKAAGGEKIIPDIEAHSPLEIEIV